MEKGHWQQDGMMKKMSEKRKKSNEYKDRMRRERVGREWVEGGTEQSGHSR